MTPEIICALLNALPVESLAALIAAEIYTAGINVAKFLSTVEK